MQQAVRSGTVGGELFIETNIMRNRAQLGYGDSLCIRKSRIGLGFGVVDLVLLPLRGPHNIVLVDAKQGNSKDAPDKVVGQLLLYYAGALELSWCGVRLMREFASRYPIRARSARRKSLKALSGGISPPDAAWGELRKGRKMRPGSIRLFVGLDHEPSAGLRNALKRLFSHHALCVGVISVLERDRLSLWWPHEEVM